ncbi:MAG: hypothetical protein EOP87_12530 [Verrucomicrobiaceae bacterium]|nr:MAG: hypothetical protein EOP87_12530 [Verrucomicrobiaceae bacterium]
MRPLTLHLRTFDIGAPADTPEEYAALLADRVLESWDSGADIVVFPEFSWMGLERFITGADKITGVAEMFRHRIYQDLTIRLSRPDKAAVFGTVPFRTDEGILVNRAPVMSEGRWLHQDKIHLTPWESSFTGGGPVHLWTFRGHRVAVVICLDVEVPEISAALRGSGIDLLLVPSATDNVLGVERISRCADARAVELGCHVGLCHLVGSAESALVDENMGRLAVYSPSQSTFLHHTRQDPGTILTDGFHLKSVILDMAALAATRTLQGETDPSRLTAASVRVVTA